MQDSLNLYSDEVALKQAPRRRSMHLGCVPRLDLRIRFLFGTKNAMQNLPRFITNGKLVLSSLILYGVIAAQHFGYARASLISPSISALGAY